MTRPSRVAGIVPAAGRSRRFGPDHKLLAPFGDTTIIGATLTALRGGGIEPLVVIVRPDDERLRAQLERLGTEIAVNSNPERGMLSSIQAGVEALGGAEELVAGGIPLAVCPADLPALTSATVRSLRRHFLASDDELVLPLHHRHSGHPLLIAPDLVAEIDDLDPRVGLRQLLDLHPDRIARLEVDDPGCVRDIDTPEDYERMT